jgi:hypothetical protein
MTEKKRIPEQIASHTYKRQRPIGTVGMAHPIARREVNKEEIQKETRVAPRVLQRVVTIPEADPSTAWNTFAQRQEQRRRARAQPQKYVTRVQRAHTRTGGATGRRSRLVQRSLASYQSVPVPVRSGRRRAGRGFLWKLLGLLTGAVMLVLAASFAFTSNAFRIEQVNVVGTHNDALIHEIRTMGMQGQNIFLINVEALTERIEAIPRVASVSMSKQWPNQITINVTERVPVLLWQTANGTYSVDNQGVVIAPVSAGAAPNNVMTVVDMSGQDKGKGNMRERFYAGMRLDSADVAFAIAAFKLLPRMVGVSAFKLGYDGTIYANTSNNGAGMLQGSYIVESQDGWISYLGGPNDANPLENRLIELQQILTLAHKQQLDLATIDLRYGLHPVYTLKS